MPRHPESQGANAAWLTSAAVVLALCGCAPAGVRPPQQPWPERLSEWRLFTGELARLEPNAGVLAYTLNTPLFSDYALKHRTVWMPPGRFASADGPGLLELPQGTVFSKTFFYYRTAGDARLLTDTPAAGDGRVLIETRLLVHAQEGWVALPYVWNEAQSEATLEIAGDQRGLVFAGASGPRAFDYLVPNVDQCASCHVSYAGAEARLRPIGPTLRNLSRPGRAGARAQLAIWRDHGYLLADVPEVTPLPAWDEPDAGIQARARAYLDVQCAHCHERTGPASSSGLYLGYDETDPLRLGVCKTPVAAGRGSGGLRYDTVPGSPERSILVFRMASSEPDIAMPELGRALRHDEGLALVREWVASLDGSCEPDSSS